MNMSQKDFTQYKSSLLGNDEHSFGEYFISHVYYGLHQTKEGWTLRVKNPHAKSIRLVTELSDWKSKEEYSLEKLNQSDWEIKLDADAFVIDSRYALEVSYEDSTKIETPNLCAVKCFDKTINGDCAIVAEENSFETEMDFHFSINHFKKQYIYKFDIEQAFNPDFVMSDFIKNLKLNNVQSLSLTNVFYNRASQASFSLNSKVKSLFNVMDFVSEAHQNGLLVFVEVDHLALLKDLKLEKLLISQSETLFYLSSLNYFFTRCKFDGALFNNIDNFFERSENLKLSYEAKVFIMTMTEVLNESNPLATLIAESYVDKPEYYLEIADGGLGFDFQVNKRLDVLGQLLNQSIWDIGSISNEITKKSKKYTQRSTCLILIEEKTPFSHKRLMKNAYLSLEYMPFLLKLCTTMVFLLRI